MELTKEHFDTQLGELNIRLDSMATKADLEFLRQETKQELASMREVMATKEDLKNLRIEMEAYTDSATASIIEAIDSEIKKLDKRLSVVEARI